MKRREFLQTTTWSTLAMPFALKRNNPNASSWVELAIATICMDGFGDQNFEPTFLLAPKIGIRNVEFNVWFARNLTPSGIQSIRDRCEMYQLRPISLQGTSFGGNIVRDVTHKLWVMQQAKNLGCNRVKFTGSGRGTNGGLDHIIAVLKELKHAAEDLHLHICVENHAKNNLETIEDYDQLFAAVDSPFVGMCLDMGHFDGSGIDNMEVVDRFHTKINHVDIKDNIQKGTYKSVPYGQGITQGETILEKLLSKGYSGYLVIEQAPPMENLDILEEMKRIKGIFEKFER